MIFNVKTGSIIVKNFFCKMSVLNTFIYSFVSLRLQIVVKLYAIFHFS